MTWNYRACLRWDGSCSLHEVHYDKQGNVKGWTANPIGFVGDDKTDLLASLKRAIDSAERHPVLDLKETPP